MRSKPPCMDCDRRVPGCHSMCNDFKAWKAEEDRKKTERDKARDLDGITYSARLKKAYYKKIKEGKK